MKLKWFTRANNGPIDMPVEVELPDQKEYTRLDEHSPTWRYIVRYVDDEISRLRAKNDSYRLDHEMTTLIRGQIKALKALRDLPNAGRDDRPGNRPPILNSR